MYVELKDKVAVITGGSSGIGQACCLAFARAGAQVVVASRTLNKAEAVVKVIYNSNDSAGAVEVDVRLGQHIQRMFDFAVTKFGGIDILINNAGISPVGSVTDISEADWDDCIAVDLRSVFLGAKYVIPELRKRGGGVILNTAGTLGIRACRGKAAYSAAKAGVLNLTRSIALDYARDRIRCNAICPGYVDTPLNAHVEPKVRNSFLAQYQPLPGIITAEEVANLALYLASESAKMITGQIFVIDGGQQAEIY